MCLPLDSTAAQRIALTINVEHKPVMGFFVDVLSSISTLFPNLFVAFSNCIFLI
jgi:hypothetical protein